jgi:hypothetical protein
MENSREHAESESRAMPQVSRHITRYPTQKPARGHNGLSVHVPNDGEHPRTSANANAASPLCTAPEPMSGTRG